jgi:hypothetical protein
MNAHELLDTARALVAGDKGLLAMEKEMGTTMSFPQLAKAAA